MDITSSNLESLRVGFKTLYSQGLGMAQPMWNMIAEEVPSTHLEENYGWLGEMPGMREWVGPRVVHALKEHDFRIKNKDFELTYGVSRTRIEDDSLGIYSNRFRQMGKSTGSQYDLSVWALLKAGFSTLCYDGQYMFDSDHPVLDADGSVQSVSNTGGGGGTPWFLVDMSQVTKPVILQVRKRFEFVSKDRLTDDNVFNQKEFLYGVDGRYNVGFGLWQMAYGSKDTLNAANYSAAYAALEGMRGDYGRPLGMKPTHLVVPPSLRSAGQKLLNSEYGSGGETNEWKGTAELMVSSWLA